MSFPVEFKKFKKISSDAKSTVLQHPAGHKITIAHAALNDNMKQALHSLPHYAEGGMSDEPQRNDLGIPGLNININAAPQPQMSMANPDESYQKEYKMQKMLTPGEPDSIVRERALNLLERQNKSSQVKAENQDVDKQQAALADYNKQKALLDKYQSLGVTPPADLKLPPNPVPEPMPTQTSPNQGMAAEMSPAIPQNPDPYGFGAQQDAMMRGIGEERAGIMQEAATQGALGKAQANIETQGAQNLQSAFSKFDKQQSDLMQQRSVLQKAMSENQFDPKRYINNMSTGSKIANVIGLILGGIGGALTHQENPALRVLQTNIDRDIEAQKNDFGKRQTLLEANYRDLGNIRDAMTMTRVMQTDMISQQLRAEAAKAMDPAARANALKAAGALDLQNAPLIQQMSMRRSLMNGAQQGQKDPETMIKMLAPPGEQEKLFKDLKEAQDTTRLKDNLLSAFDQLEKKNTVGNRIAHLGFEPAEVEAIRDPLLAQLSKDTAGRFTEADAGYLKSIFPAPGDSAATAMTKRKQLNALIQQKMNFPSLKYYGYDPGGGKFSQSGEKKIKLGPPVK